MNTKYIPLQYQKKYIQECSKRYDEEHKEEAISNLIKIFGYKDPKSSKLITLRKRWDNLQTNIPTSYLDAIGLEFDILEKEHQKDCDAFHKKINEPFFPEYTFTTSFHIGDFFSKYYTEKIHILFPKNTSEIEALKLLAAHANRLNKDLHIIQDNVKEITVAPNNNINYTYFYPVLKISKSKKTIHSFLCSSEIYANEITMM